MLEERIDIDGIPTRVYRPDGADALLLLGHGGGHGKDAPRFVDLGRQYAEGTGLAVVCIDAIDHGDRKPANVSPGIPPRWHSTALPEMVKDWHTAADALSSIGPAVGYVGFSMGTIFGISTVAAMVSIKAAVFVVGGVPEGGGIDDPPLRSRLLEDAARLRHASVLMMNKTDDEIFPTESARDVFDALPGPKELRLSEGGHDEWSPAMITESIDFLRHQALS